MIKNYSLACAVSLALFGCGGSSTDTPTTPTTPGIPSTPLNPSTPVDPSIPSTPITPSTPIVPATLSKLTPIVQLIPAPFELSQEDGSWVIDENTTIRYMGETLKDEAQYLSSKLKEDNNVTLTITELTKLGTLPVINSIELVIDPSVSESDEGYTLNVSDGKARIIGDTDAGVFYGVQSLLQLVALDKQNVPNVSITDAPRFEWRGMHLDVARNFVEVADVKKFLDQLAYHKINKFHWHLTDDQGWRIEIKGWEKLTEIGGCKPGTPPYGNRGGNDKIEKCGFYTQEQIKEIVAYAEERHIEVVPEIDMPGHMTAAVAAYPELGVQDSTEFLQDVKEWDAERQAPTVKFGWGVHPYLLNNDQATFDWIDIVFGQVAELFPNSDYIHLGGDEAHKRQWQTSPKAKAKIVELKGYSSIDQIVEDDYKDLQAAFIAKVEKIITSKGKIVVGWNEILEGDGISTDTVIMSWQGQGPGVEAAKEGHPVVMASGLYFDFYQAPEALELAKGVEYEAIGNLTTIKDVYGYEPIPSNLPEELHDKILGAQGNLWSEYMHTYDKVEYQAFPRVTALSEVLWSAKDKRNYDNFLTRLPATLARLDAKKVNRGDVYNSKEAQLNDGTAITTNMQTNGSNGLWKIRDFDASTLFWTGAGQTTGDQITLTLAKPISSGYINLLAGTDSGGDTFSADIEVSSDGETWGSLFSITNATAAAAEFTSPISHIRLSVTADKNNWFAVRELGYGQLASVQETSVANGDVLMTITPQRDVFTGDTVTYAIESGNSDSAYAIDSQTGVITVIDSTALTVDADTVQMLVIKVTDSKQLNLVENQQAYIKIENDVDDSILPGVERWETVVKADTVASKMLPTSVSIIPVLAQSPRTVDLSGIDTATATYEFFIKATDISQASAVLLSSVDGDNKKSFRQEQYNNTEKYGATYLNGPGSFNDATFADAVAGVATPTSIYGADAHVVIVVDSSMKLYLNGVLSGLYPNPMIINAVASKLGDTSGDRLGNDGDEVIKAFAAYNSVLTQAQITARYDALTKK